MCLQVPSVFVRKSGQEQYELPGSRPRTAGGNFSRNKSGPKYTSSSRRKSHLSPARSNRGASLPSSLSVCWYDRRESLSISVSAVLFFVELESTGGIISLLFSVEIGDNFQRLPVIMTMNSGGTEQCGFCRPLQCQGSIFFDSLL